MEIIKFRIYDTKYKYYVEEPDFRWTLSRNGKLYNSENDEWYNVGERYIVEFFTGLTDKNGKEIYVGDILDFTIFDCFGYDTQHKGKVIFELGQFLIYTTSKECYSDNNMCVELFWVEYQYDEIEVIGSIHTNLELLTEK